MTVSGASVLADAELAAAAVADALGLGRRGYDVVGCAAVGAGAAAAHALDNRLVGDFDAERAVDVNAGLLESLGLRDGPRHTVEDVTAGAVALGEALLDDADYDIVGDELPRFNEALGLEAHGGAVLHGGAENVAGGLWWVCPACG